MSGTNRYAITPFPSVTYPSGGDTNVAVITPEFAGFVAYAAQGTVKAFSATPSKVNPGLAVSVIVAVYDDDGLNVAGEPPQLTVPVYWSVSAIEVMGLPPLMGAIASAILRRVTVWGAAHW